MCTRFLASKGLLAKYLKLNKPRTQLASSLFDAASQLTAGISHCFHQTACHYLLAHAPERPVYDGF